MPASYDTTLPAFLSGGQPGQLGRHSTKEIPATGAGAETTQSGVPSSLRNFRTVVDTLSESLAHANVRLHALRGRCTL